MSRLLRVALAAAATCALLAPALAGKPKKPKPACDLGYLPFTPGATWTYAFFIPGDAPDRQGIYVKDPDSLTIKVTEIGKDGDATVIKLEESYRSRKVATEVRCGKDGLTASPTSFYFFGEPGGGIGMELAELTRQGGEYGKALKGGEEQFEELKAKAIRTPAAGSGATLANATVEIERKAVVGGNEDVESKMGSHDATRVDIELTGRANLEGQPKDKEFNMPGARATLWFAKGIGVVRVESSQGKGWQLSAFSDGTPVETAPPAP